MRVAYVGHGIANPKHGAQSSTRRLLDHMIALDSDVEFFGIPKLSQPPTPERNRLFSGTPVDHFAWMFHSSRALARLCRKEKIDIINIHGYGGYTTIPPREIPTIFTPHDEPLTSFWDYISRPHLSLVSGLIRESNRFFVRNALKHAPHAIAISSSIKSQLVRIGLSEKNIQVIPHGFLQKLPKRELITREQLTAKLGIPPDAKLVLSVGALVFGKGIHKTLQAARMVRQVRHDVHFIHVGKIATPIERGYVRSLRRWLDLDKAANFHLLGPMDHDLLLETMQIVDLYLSASYAEACSQALMEGMTAGLPIVCTDAGAARDLLNGRAHILRRDCNPAEICNAVLESIDQSAQQYPLVKRLTWREIAKRTLTVYLQVLERAA